MRVIISASLLFCVSFTAVAEKKQMKKELFIDFVGTKSITAMCERDPRFKKCLNFTKERCAEVVIKITPDCQKRLLESMPDTISEREEFNKYGIEFSTCAGTRMVLESGKDINEVNACFGAP